MLQCYYQARGQSRGVLEDTYDDDEQERHHRQLGVHAVVLAGVLCQRQQRLDRRNQHRNYLTRPDLNLNPWFGDQEVFLAA